MYRGLNMACKFDSLPSFIETRYLLHMQSVPLCFSLGTYSLSGMTSCHQISRSLEAARLYVMLILSLWNLTGISAALLPRYLSNFRAIGKFYALISELRDFTRSCGKTSYHLVKRPWLYHTNQGCTSSLANINAIGTSKPQSRGQETSRDVIS